MQIVVIDDSITNLIVLKSLAASLSDGKAIGFSDPETAAAHLSANPADVVVLDYSMPKMNGVQLIERIRAMPGHKGTPIVMVTHSTDQATRMCALSAGATAFLSKPVNATEFKTLVRELRDHHNKDLVVGDRVAAVGG